MIGNLEQVPGKIPWAVHSKDCNVMLHHHNFPFPTGTGMQKLPKAIPAMLAGRGEQ